ncbi:ferrochelatase [Sphingorhabdus lutea]|uniref:Ferrochelatase n=1 Tax=Sphingorhabdus lutea TaxID=1913578 RepID=A0A1L3JAH4_9SPHN|nr:ferrochelatase [Sphingorhabdus lutea]APG62119.1 ferrochelatase [Sphingorhabdus lutea]
MNAHLPREHPPVPHSKVGLLLVNLGTPEAAEPKAVKKYLKEFLSDKRVVEIPALIWQPILRGIILNTRPKKSAAAYAKVWTDKGSPLAFYTAAQADKMAAILGDKVMVKYAMRYGNPSIADQLSAMKAAGCNRILIAPLYPQYSGATTGTVLDKAYETLSKMRWHPALRTLPPYHDDEAYINALQQSVQHGLEKLNYTPDAVIISFHGMPERTLQLGDPYHCHCQKTARLLSEKMGIKFEVSFQSRFGRAKWLEPATDATIEKLAQEGKKNIAIFAPGFSVDCLETLEELAIAGQEQFLEAGGEKFAYLPCLNDSDIGMEMLVKLLRRELSGWI